ncbi:MAG: acyl-ACP thioesterase domain-containing protein [Actinomycetota bacterium]
MTASTELPPIDPLALREPAGRTFGGRRKVRLGDVDADGRLRLDALTRYTQDVSDDDTADAGLDAEPGWVVRSTVVDELVPAGLGEWLSFDTFCTGTGGRWAERRLSIAGEGGGRYEVATLWVCVDATTGRPHRLTDQFIELYGEAAAGRRVSARLVNPTLSPPEARSAPRSWQVRSADHDVYRHVNNAAYWAVVEEWGGAWSGPRRIRLEYGAGISGVDRIDVVTEARADGCALWWLPPPSDDGTGESGVDEPLASALVRPLPPDLYDPT